MLTQGKVEPEKKGRKGPKCGAKTRARGTCKQAAGWRTDHPGAGPCYLHGGRGVAQPGASNPAFKHGLYAKHLSSEDTVEFEAFAATLDWMKPSVEDAFVLFKCQKLLMGPGPIKPLEGLKALEIISRVKTRYRVLLEDINVNVTMDGPMAEHIINATVAVLAKYLPDEVADEALGEYRQLVAGGGDSGAVSRAD